MPELRTKTGTFDNITFTVREELGVDAFDEIGITRHLPERLNEDVRQEQFARCVLQTTKVEGMTWSVSLSSPKQQINEAYEQWCRLSRNVLTGWSNLTYQVNVLPSSEEALAPIVSGEE